MPRLKVDMMARKRALTLLAEGKTVKETVTILMEKHPELNYWDVRRAYFPRHGPFMISRHEGKSREQILAVVHELDDVHARLVRQMQKATKMLPTYKYSRRDRGRRVTKIDPLKSLERKMLARKER